MICFKRGITLAEVLVVVALSVVLFALVFTVFTRFNQNKTLAGATNETMSIISEARSLTLGAKENTVYGVHFESDQVTLFKGSTFSSSDPDNKVTSLGPSVSLATTSIAGGGSDIVFQRLTGKTSNNGVLTLTLISTGVTATITIQETGITEDG